MLVINCDYVVVVAESSRGRLATLSCSPSGGSLAVAVLPSLPAVVDGFGDSSSSSFLSFCECCWWS